MLAGNCSRVCMDEKRNRRYTFHELACSAARANQLKLTGRAEVSSDFRLSHACSSRGRYVNAVFFGGALELCEFPLTAACWFKFATRALS